MVHAKMLRTRKLSVADGRRAAAGVILRQLAGSSSASVAAVQIIASKRRIVRGTNARDAPQRSLFLSIGFENTEEGICW